MQELAVKGAIEENKDLIYQAVMMDPLTSCILTMPEIHKMVTEIIEAEKQWLPKFLIK